jgi:hypothetical protein
MRLVGITVQDNPVCELLLYLMTEEGDFVLPLQMKGTNVMANTCTPTAQELHDCTHIVLLSKHPWDPQRVRYPESSRTVQEEIEMQRSIGGVRVSCGGVSREEPANEKLSKVFLHGWRFEQINLERQDFKGQSSSSGRLSGAYV